MRLLQTLAASLILALTGPVLAYIPHYSGDVTVEIITDDGRVLPVHALGYHDGNAYRAYLEK